MPAYAQPCLIAPGRQSALLQAQALRASRSFAASRVPYALLLLFVVLLYAQLGQVIPALDALRPVYLVGSAAVAAVVIERLLAGKGIAMIMPDSVLLVGFLGIAVLSCFTSVWPYYAVQNTADLFKAGALHFIIVNTVVSRHRLQKLLYALAIAGLFPALGTLKNHVAGIFVEGNRAAWVGIFANPNEVAYALVVLAPVAVYAIGQTRSSKPLFLLVLAAYVAAILVTFSRGGVLGFLAVILFGLRSRRLWVRAATLAIVAAAFAFMFLWWSRGAGFTDLGQDLNFQQRLATLQAGMAMFLDYPLLGVGVGCSVVAWPLYAPAGVPTPKSLVIHNTLVQTLSETGIAGFLFFILLLMVALYSARSLARLRGERGTRDLARMSAALETSLWGFVVCGLSGGFAWTWFPYLIISMVSSAKRIAAGDAAQVGLAAGSVK